MPPPAHPPLPKAAQPNHSRNFDPWNSVALGHQRAETRGPQGWRENRTRKLHSQLAAGSTGGARLSDAVGAGSEDYDEARGVLIPKEVRARATNSVMDMLRKPGTMARGSGAPGGRREGRSTSLEPRKSGAEVDEMVEVEEEKEEEGGRVETTVASRAREADSSSSNEHSGETAKSRIRDGDADCDGASAKSGGIFDGLVIYVNGSTHPLVSDHRLKHLLVENGARMSIHLGRRQVTHVILGRPSGPSSHGRGSTAGAGGGLAGGKLEREIRRVGGCGVKYVGVEW